MLRRLMLAAIVVAVSLQAGPLLPQLEELDGLGAEPEATELTGGEGRGRPMWLDPEGSPLPFADVDETLEFLAEAEVLRSWSIPTGSTQPRKLLLEREGVRAHAIFHDVDVQRRRERLRGGKVVYFFRDHYANNVAAFELSRLLGMSNVPPAVVRREGSVQLWIEHGLTEAERRQQEIVPPGEWRLTARDMQIFDNLVNNLDRNQGNVLYDAHWNLWYIDHTRAFNRGRELPSPERVKRCSRRLWRALRELDEAEVRRVLAPYLGGHEIDAILHRRELLLTLIRERIDRQGEEAVLFIYGDAAGPVAAGAEKREPPAPPPP